MSRKHFVPYKFPEGWWGVGVWHGCPHYLPREQVPPMLQWSIPISGRPQAPVPRGIHMGDDANMVFPRAILRIHNTSEYGHSLWQVHHCKTLGHFSSRSAPSAQSPCLCTPIEGVFSANHSPKHAWKMFLYRFSEIMWDKAWPSAFSKSFRLAYMAVPKCSIRENLKFPARFKHRSSMGFSKLTLQFLRIEQFWTKKFRMTFGRIPFNMLCERTDSCSR